MKKSMLKRRSLIITTVLATAAVAYVVLIFLPKQKAISELQAELIEKQEYILRADQLISALQLTQLELDGASAFVTDWENTAPTKDTLFGDIESDARAAGVAMPLFDPQTVVEMETVSQVPVVIAIEGSFSEIFDFVARLEARPNTIWMEGLAVQPTEPEMIWGLFPLERLRCEMTLLIFADKSDFSG